LHFRSAFLCYSFACDSTLVLHGCCAAALAA
jgi:hypothetical protein